METCAPAYRTAKTLAFTFFFVAFAFFYGCGSEGTDVTVKNDGTDTVRSATLHVTGNTYTIGDIPPGGSRSVSVAVEGESHVELSHGQGRRFVFDVYLEPGYGGRIDAVITSDSIIAVDQDF